MELESTHEVKVGAIGSAFQSIGSIRTIQPSRLSHICENLLFATEVAGT